MCSDIRIAIGELLDLTRASLDNFPLPNGLRYSVLGAIIAAEHEHVSAIIALPNCGFSGSAKILLRPLLEGWIVAKYVMQEENDERAKQYVRKGLLASRRFLKRLVWLAEEHPDEQTAVLSAGGITSLEECKSRLASVEADIQLAKDQGGFLPSLGQCASTLDLTTQLTYYSLYGVILSETTHLGPAAVLRLLGPGRTDTETQDDLARILWTSLALLLDLVRLSTGHLGTPDSAALVRFDGIAQRARPV